MFDCLNFLIWQNAQQGRKHRTGRPPKPLPRPGLPEPKDRQHWGKPAPLSKVKELLAASRPGAQPADAPEGEPAPAVEVRSTGTIITRPGEVTDGH